MKILVIGDSCTDIYHYGKCTRLAPEGPVPVFMITRTETNGGMAKNVYENILSLKNECDLITNSENITKMRYVEEKKNHLFLRVDSHERKVARIIGIENINFSIYDCIIISDYDHGFLTESDIEYITSKSNGVVFLDTKKKLGLWCSAVNFIKINEHEYEKTKDSLSNIFEEKLIVTLGEKGCKYKNKLFSVIPVEVKDMEGAGDTFLSALAHDYIRTKDIYSSIELANKYATIVVQHKGVNKIGDFL
jgi:bifunctional ADP-heptose synthase (sugar kinase/adenylyltransferase)